LGEEPLTFSEAAWSDQEADVKASTRDHERHELWLELQYRGLVTALVEQAISRNGIVSEEMNDQYSHRLTEQALSEIESREEEIVGHPKALQEIILPMVRLMVTEEARFIWGWDELF
jgi:hypothetical protein